MTIIYIIFGILVVAGALLFFTNLKENIRTTEEKEIEKENIGKYFYLKNGLFSYREKPFFDELQKQNNNQFVILSKVRMEDLVGVSKGIDQKKYKPMRNHIKSRHIDFAILSNSGKILALIEVDDKSHNTEKAKNGDDIKNQIFEFVGVNFYRVKVGENYSEKITEIFGEIKRT